MLSKATGWLLVLSLAGVEAGAAIRLKTRSLVRPVERGSQALKRKSASRSHYLVQLDRPPDAETIAEWSTRGIRVTGYVPDSAVVVSAPDDVELAAPGLRWAGRMAREDKISPLVSAAEELEEAPGAYLVEFYPDVDMEQARALVTESGVQTAEHPDLLSTQLLVLGSAEQAASLAEWDEVAYVFPASLDLAVGNRVTACAGAVTDEGAIGQYVKASAGWSAGPNGVELSYYFKAATEKLPASTVQSEVVRAFSEWSKYAPLVFRAGASATAPRTIAILFGKGAHGDGYAFDGPGRVLAHTFYPAPPNAEPLAGDMHFDDDENWDDRSHIDLYTVALHEAGHALGLGHSDRPGAVMYPYYRVGLPLASDDIAGIRALYPARQSAGALGLAISAPAGASVATTAASIAMVGTTSGGTGTVQVTWRASQGGSGRASGSGNWTIAAVPLANGVNVITVTATDSAGKTASRSVTVTRQGQAPPGDDPPGPGAPGGAPPALQITSPSFTILSTAAASITLRGTASASATSVTWTNSAGGSGTAAGTANWSATVPLQMGTNAITIRAFNSSGSSWRAVTVVRR